MEKRPPGEAGRKVLPGILSGGTHAKKMIIYFYDAKYKNKYYI